NKCHRMNSRRLWRQHRSSTTKSNCRPISPKSVWFPSSSLGTQVFEAPLRGGKMHISRRSIATGVGIGVVVLLFGYFKYRFDSKYGPQRESILTIERLGGKVQFGSRGRGTFTTNNAFAVSFTEHELSADEMQTVGACLKRLPRLKRLWFAGNS